MSEILYRKVGRRYVPVSRSWRLDPPSIRAPIGQYVLAYSYAEGGQAFSYTAKPDTAGFIAAVLAFRSEFALAMNARVPSTPQVGRKPFSKEEKKLIEKFRKDMAAIGSLIPTFWESTSADELVDAAIDAMMRKGERNS